ncbi:ubiquitin carboxyl-terminal hydrolase 8-like [Asterias rubens]|uniref:ubiquitin carboxyl-terminal hydrolase 8-like n=1 Tax=Asterias rubens TaxID=7604 RepID=UPI001454E9BD|nr:ubiquitin carboxyl-terminal hydrolase 8-like [Asterias rubens]XP_033625204.1 ubiquitin carboxyl-terminal hydrolase 8-like [Asterias rubens]
MPAKDKVQLYIAKSIEELNKKADFAPDKNTKAKIYCKSADKIIREADKAYRSQDEERAYVLYMKFICIIQYISKMKEYKLDKEYYDNLGGTKHVISAIEKAETLQTSLLRRYKDLEEEQQVQATCTLAANDSSSDESIKKPRNSTTNGVANDSAVPYCAKNTAFTPEFGQNGKIVAAQLYKLLQDDTYHILLMDARSTEHFQASHMQCQQVINVPQETIKPGITVTNIVKCLKAEARTLWTKRGDVDCIVLFDWNSTLKDLTKSSTLVCLKDAIYKWDSLVTLKREPIVLDGGYESWLVRYPMLTTNPHVNRPTTTSDASSTTSNLLNFDYPSLEDEQPRSLPTASPVSAQVKSSHAIDVNGQISTPSEPAATSTSNSVKCVPSVDRSSKPKQPNEHAASKPDVCNLSTSHGSFVTQLDNTEANKEIISNQKPKVTNVNQPSSSSSSANGSTPANEQRETLSPNIQPVIPHRSLKPPLPNNTNPSQNTINDGINVSVKSEDESVNKQMQLDKLTSDKILKDKDVNESNIEAGEISREQQEHKIREQKARQELENMRQEKIRTENKQLRLEKAEMETQLEEQVKAYQRMQQELEVKKLLLEENAKVREEEQKAELKKEEQSVDTKSNTIPELSTESVNPPTPVKAKLTPEDKPSMTSKTEPHQSQPSMLQTKPSHRVLKPVDPKDHSVQQVHTNSSVLPASSSGHVSVTSGSVLPPGWEKKLHPSTNKYYYLDHNTETTHWNPPADVGPGGAASLSNPNFTMPVTTTSPSQRPGDRVTGSPARQSAPTQTKTRLKSDSSSGTPKSSLKRSFSSPNIAQMVVNENEELPGLMPAINRSNKPIQRTPSSSMIQKPQQNKPLSVTRARNLNPVYGNNGRSLTGLRNLGNTCFMNSVVQCLSNTTPLTHYFITDKYVMDINRQNPLGRGGNVAEEFAIVIKAVWSGQYRSVSPLDLRDTVTKYVPEFRKHIGHHHDSQEFLLFLLDGLHEDLNQVRKREYIKQEDLDKYTDSKAAELSWQYHHLLNQSIIVTLFQGQYKSTLRCLSCGHNSVKFEAFMYLSLPIPSNSRCSLQQCLKKFSTEEKLTGDNATYCSQCKTNRESSKTILIWKLPRILLIHLKRFYYEGMWRQKLQTMVDFPLRDMDMSPYTIGPKPSNSYNLYAVSNHIGTLDGGHYTACCLNVNNNRWNKFDDHEVLEAKQSNIKSAAAYILFYTSLDSLVP